MNRYQVARQLAFLLQNANWPGGGYQVFAPGSVVITTEPPANALAELRPPAVLIHPTTVTSDRANPQILTLRFNVVLLAVVGGARLHGSALEGGVRTQGQLGSQGRGLLELEEVLAQTVDALGSTSGVRLFQRRVGDEAPVVENDVNVAMSAVYRLEGQGVRDRYYEPPADLVAQSFGSGVARLTWTNPSARWDWRRPIVRWAAGSTPPATPTSGTDASPTPVNSSTQRSASNVVTVDVTTGSGTKSFAVFAAYDETFSNTDERFSGQEPGTTATASVN